MPSVSAPDPDPRLDGLSVLVVEDESLVYFLIEDMLIELGCATVWRAADIATALSLLQDRRPELAILDVNIGGEASYPVATRLDDLGIPLVFSTGFGRSGLPPAWQGRPVLEKPFNMAGLVAALGEALRTAEVTEPVSHAGSPG